MAAIGISQRVAERRARALGMETSPKASFRYWRPGRGLSRRPSAMWLKNRSMWGLRNGAEI